MNETKHSYQVKQIGISDFDVLIPLMKDCFGLDVNTSFFEWKYKKNPSGEFVGFIALDEHGDVGAYYGAIPETYMVSGQQRIIYQSCDTMTHSAHRRRGLFRLLANHCYDHLRAEGKLFIMGFGGKMSLPGFLAFGWKEVTRVQQVFYPSVMAKLRIGKDKYPYSVRAVADTGQIAHLLEKSNSGTEIHSVKNRAIFNWRMANPLHQYELFAAWNENDQAEGYICYYAEHEKIYLFDIYAENLKAERALLARVKKDLSIRKLKRVQALCTRNSFMFQALKRNGFISSPFKKWPEALSQAIIFYSTEELMNRYAGARFWNITPFDHDTF